jgi:hypothetical protein
MVNLLPRYGEILGKRAERKAPEAIRFAGICNFTIKMYVIYSM